MNLFKTIFYTIVISIFLVSCKKDPLPVLTLSADKIVFSNKTSTETISVSSNYNWSISNDSDWISITPTSSTGESTVKISATENNTDSDRTTNLVVTTGKEGTPSYLRKVISNRCSVYAKQICHAFLRHPKSIIIEYHFNTCFALCCFIQQYVGFQ